MWMEIHLPSANCCSNTSAMCSFLDREENVGFPFSFGVTMLGTLNSICNVPTEGCLKML